jgi:hypothetical protein
VEYWNSGIVGQHPGNITQHSNIPTFQYADIHICSVMRARRIGGTLPSDFI